MTRPAIVMIVSYAMLSAAAHAESPAVPAVVDAPLRLAAGTWDAAVQYYEDDKPTRAASGVEVNTLLVDGHWIVSDFRIPAAGNSPAYQEHGMWGYDAVAKTYVGASVDTNEQTVRTDYGSWSEPDTTMVWSSKQNDGNGHFTDYRMVEEFKGQQRIFTVYELGSLQPNPHTVLKIVFTKKQVPDPDAPHRKYQRPGSGHVP